MAMFIIVLCFVVSTTWAIKEDYCGQQELMDRAIGKIVNPQPGDAEQCKKNVFGRPESPLLKFCNQSVGRVASMWRKDNGENIWNLVCKSKIGQTPYTPIATFDGQKYKADGGAAILRFCGHDGIYVLNQWCGKDGGFSWHFLPKTTAKQYHRVTSTELMD